MSTHTPDFFAPTGPMIQLHRDEAKSIGIDFSGALAGANPSGATVAVTFWQRSGARWIPAGAGAFGAPTPEWTTADATVRFWVRGDSGGAAPAGEWGAKIAVTTADGQIHVADCTLLLMGAMSA